jgi:tRNA U34 5-carboxymethylaminomethyl modifying enzyme MnmG/GidA
MVRQTNFRESDVSNPFALFYVNVKESNMTTVATTKVDEDDARQATSMKTTVHENFGNGMKFSFYIQREKKQTRRHTEKEKRKKSPRPRPQPPIILFLLFKPPWGTRRSGDSPPAFCPP